MRKTRFPLMALLSGIALLATLPASAAVSKAKIAAWTQRLDREFGVSTSFTPLDVGHLQTSQPEDWSRFSLARTQLDQLTDTRRTAPEQGYDRLVLAEISPQLEVPSAERQPSRFGHAPLFPLADRQADRNSPGSDWRRYGLQPDESGQPQTGPRKDWSRFLFAQAQTAPSGAPTAQPAADEPINLEEISKKLNNPLSDLWIVFNQNDTSLWHGAPNTGDDAVINVLTIQPVLPVPLTRDWNLVTRPIIPLITAPTFRLPGNLRDRFGDSIGGGCPPNCLNEPPGAPPVEGLSLDTKRKFGIGDFNIWSMLSPADPQKWKGIIWGIGPSFLFPTASIEQFGSGKYAMGPATLIMNMRGKWTFGLFHQTLFDIGGDSDKPSYKVSQFQPIIWYNLPKLWSIGMAPMVTVDWNAGSGNELTFPLGLGISKTFLAFGKMPMRMGIEVHYSVVHPDNYGQRWNFRFYMIPVLPNPFKDRPLFGS